MPATDLDHLCAQLFGAFERHDLDAVEAMLAVGAVITQNGNSMPWTDARPMIAGLLDVIREVRYDDVRRIVGDHVVVEEHTVVGESPTGRPIRLAACAVVRVDDNGLISAIDEYVDVPDLS
jgi:ketosteroid isomerase-like protein